MDEEKKKSIKETFKWIELTRDSTSTTSYAEVPGGWLFRVSATRHDALTFVPKKESK